jgi:hypothetical protein
MQGWLSFHYGGGGGDCRIGQFCQPGFTTAKQPNINANDVPPQELIFDDGFEPPE